MTEEVKHTPGPWKCDTKPYFGSWYVRQDPENWNGQGYQFICEGPSANKKHDGHYAEMFEANARLIAAAPDLFDALLSLTNSADGLSFREDAIRNIVGNTNWRILREHIEAARTAIAKARGSE